MQIGNTDLDKVCDEAIVPAIKACDLEPRRVDKHNTGGLLKSEIIGFIERSEIIIADLTNERPNCYLEIGYAMGLDKFRNIILTAREDHNLESPNYTGKKVHFDLSGYDILFWLSDNIQDFKKELIKRIKRRQAILTQATEKEKRIPWDEEWIDTHRKESTEGLAATGKKAFMEIRFALEQPKTNQSQSTLLKAARESQIDTFGWPIGVYLSNDKYRPKPRSNGIVAEISTEDKAAGYWTYDYWTIHKNGDFYLLKTLFEDQRDESKIFFNTRIIRVTETLLYCARLYTRLGIEPSSLINIAIKHGELKGRILSASNTNWFIREKKRCDENQIESQLRTSLSGIESNLVELVKELTAPMFMLFDFTEFNDSIYQEIVNAYVAGRTI
jgi:hypothetical protein